MNATVQSLPGPIEGEQERGAKGYAREGGGVARLCVGEGERESVGEEKGYCSSPKRGSERQRDRMGEQHMLNCQQVL